MNGSGCHSRITCDQGTWVYRGWMKNSYLVLHEKTLCNRREGVFSAQADEGEGDLGPVREGVFSEQEDEGEGIQAK